MGMFTKGLPVLLASLLISNVIAAPVQTVKQHKAPTLVQTEYAFARDVKAHGIRDGFLKYMDEQAIAFAPGPVNAKMFYEKRPAQSSTLTWYPAMARLAASDDFGFTTGPWQVSFMRDGKPGEINGDYVTIWHRKADGQWRWLLNAGAPHRDPGPKLAALPDDGSNHGYALRGAVHHKAESNDAFVALDMEYTKLATHDGMRALYNKLGSDDLRVLQFDSLPLIGRAAVLKQMPPDKAGLQWITSGSGSASSGDLAYSYGMAYTLAGPQGKVPQSVYVHVWERTRQGWRLLLDLENAMPPPRRH